jgi:hypothetical protein
MAVHLRVDPDVLRGVGGQIQAAPQGSATPPSADITSPANDAAHPVSLKWQTDRPCVGRRL